MPQIVYVNEYQPSSARLSLSQDPIYGKSGASEQIRVGMPPILPLSILMMLLILAYEGLK